MRLTEIFTAEIAKDKLIQEERLERVINNTDLDIALKVIEIKSILKEMVLTESIYAKWYNIINQEVKTSTNNIKDKEIKNVNRDN